MPEDFVMAPDPFGDSSGLDFSGFDSTGPLSIGHLTEKKKRVPYDQQLAEYKAKGGEYSTNPLARGARAGFLGGFAGDVGFFETLSDIVPFDPGKEHLKSAGDFLEEEAYAVPQRTIRDIGGVGDAIDYMGQATGYVFGYLGSLAPTAVLTGGVGAAGRIIGKEALKGLTKKEIGKRGGKAVARFATGPSIIKNIGHTYRGVREETGVESPFIATTAGVASGMLERFGLGKTFGTFFENLPYDAKRRLWTQMVRNAMRGYGKAWAIEGATETGQELIQLAANKVADSTYDVVNGENVWRVLDAAALGAFGSGPFGAIGGAGNYYGGKVSAEKDKALVESVQSLVQKIAPEGSEIIFRKLQEQIGKHAALLDEEGFSPTEDQVSAISRVTERIPLQRSLSDIQKQVLLEDANKVLGKFRDVFASAESKAADADVDIEVAARKNREAAETAAGVAPERYQGTVEPESSILPEERAPYNNPESSYHKDQEYKHRLDTPDGESIQIDAVVDLVGKDGRVLRAVTADRERHPLIITKGKRTISLHTVDDVENAIRYEVSLTDQEPVQAKKTADEVNLDLKRIEEDRLARERNKEVEEAAGGVIETTEKTTPDDLKKKQESVQLKRKAYKPKQPKEEGVGVREILRQARKESQARPTRKSTVKPEDVVKVGSDEQKRINLENKAKVLRKSKVVEVSRLGEKRNVGKITDVRLLQHFSAAIGGPRVFSIDVLWDNGLSEEMSITEDMEMSQPMNGGVTLLAKNGKLTSAQERIVSEKETGPQKEEVTETETPPASERPSATKETPPTKRKHEKPSLSKKSVVSAITEEEEAESAEVDTDEDVTTIGGRVVTDEKDAATLRQIRADEDEERSYSPSIGPDLYIYRSIIQLSRLIQKITIYIKQLYRDGVLKSKTKLNRKTRGYKKLRDEFVRLYAKSLEERFPSEERFPHLPTFAEDAKKSLGGLFDAVVDEYSKKEGVRGLSSMEDGGVSQSIARELESLILEPENISKYLDFPITDNADEEKTVVIANGNVFKNTDTGWTINNVYLYSDDTSQTYVPVIDFTDQKGTTITIKATGKGMDAIAYRLTDEAMKKVRFQKSKIAGREEITTFAHIPESLLFVEDEVQYDNWEVDSKKSGGKWLKDVSWVGLSKEDFEKFLKERVKDKRLKKFLESDESRVMLDSKEEVAGLVSNGIRLSADPRYKPSNSKARTAKRELSKRKDSKIALLSVDDLLKLLSHSINLHLDHFSELTNRQLERLQPDITELNRLKSYRDKLSKAYQEKKIPTTIDIPKLNFDPAVGPVLSPVVARTYDEAVEIARKQGWPSTGVKKEDSFVQNIKRSFFSIAESREGIPVALKRKTLREDDFKEIEKTLEIVSEKIGELESKVTQARGGSGVIDDRDSISLEATVPPRAAAAGLQRARSLYQKGDLKQPDILTEAPDVEQILNDISRLEKERDTLKKKKDQLSKSRIAFIEQDLADLERRAASVEEAEYELEGVASSSGQRSTVEAARMMSEKNADYFADIKSTLASVYPSIAFYNEGIESEKEKFSAEYRSILPSEEATQDDPASQLERAINIEAAKSGSSTDTGLVEAEDPSAQAIAREQAEEEEKLEDEDAEFDEDTEIGRAIKEFKKERAVLLGILESKDENDPLYTSKLIDSQASFLKAWSEFMRKRGTDFIASKLVDGKYELQPRTEADLDVYNLIVSENLSRAASASMFETINEKIERDKARFFEAEAELSDLYESYEEATNIVNPVLESIREETQRYIDSEYAKGIEERGFLSELGWVGQNGNKKTLLPADVTIHKVLTSPEKFAGVPVYAGSPMEKKLRAYKPTIDGYIKARGRRDDMAIAISRFNEDLAVVYGVMGKKTRWIAEPPDPHFIKLANLEKGPKEKRPAKYTFTREDFEKHKERAGKLDSEIKKLSEETAAGAKKLDDLIATLSGKVSAESDPKKKRKLQSKLAGARGKKKEAAQKLTDLRAERVRSNTVVSLILSTAKADKRAKKFKMVASRLKKREDTYKHVFDSFVSGGARGIDIGNLFSRMVSLTNAYSEDEFNQTGKFSYVKIKQGQPDERTETAATLYYKLYKIFEIRDPYKIFSHPMFHNSGLYIGPIRPEGMTEEVWAEGRPAVIGEDGVTELKPARPGEKWMRREVIANGIGAYVTKHGMSKEAASRAFVKEVVLRAVVNDFISLFRTEAGYKRNHPLRGDAIIKKTLGINGRMSSLLDYLDAQMDVPFRPIKDAEVDQAITEEALGKLGDELGAALKELASAKEVFEKNDGKLDIARRAMTRKWSQESVVGREMSELVRFKLDSERKHREATTKVRNIKDRIDSIKSDPRILLRGDVSGNSLDIIPTKESATIKHTLPRGYTTVKGDKPSQDAPISEGAKQGMLATEKLSSEETPVEIGRASGADGIAQLLEENRTRFGDGFVDRAIEFVNDIPEKYLRELTLALRSGSLETGSGTSLAGSFVDAIKTVFIPTVGSNPDSFVHEFTHYLHAFLPEEMQQRVTAMRRDALNKVASNTQDGKLRYRIDMASVFLVNMDSETAQSADDFQVYIDRYGDKAKDMYHLINDNEFFVYLMTRSGKADISALSPERNPVGFVARVRQFLSELVDKLLIKVGFREKRFEDEVRSKFKSGEFSVERRMFAAGPEVDGAIRKEEDLKRAIEFNVRDSILGKEGGANVEAGRQLSLEAGSFHNMIYNLSQRLLKEMSEEERFRNILGDPDKEVSLSKRAAAMATIKQSAAIRRLLEENEKSSGGVIFSPEGYLQLLDAREKLSDKEKIPESMWQQVSKEFFKNTEEFVETFRELDAKAKRVQSEEHELKLLKLMSESGEKFDLRSAARNSANSFKTLVREMLKKAQNEAAQNEAIERLKQYQFDIDPMKLQHQLDDNLVGDRINKAILDFYNTVWFSQDAQLILHKGINRDGSQAGWRDLMRAYIVEKGIDLKYKKRRVGMTAADKEAAMFAEIDPILKFAADHILKKHQNDMLLNEISEKQLDASLEFYTGYEAEINALFYEDTIVTKKGDTRKVDGPRRAMDKLLSDYKKATGKEAIANRLYLSIRRNVQAQIRNMNDTIVAAELVGRIVESEEFSSARKAAADVIDAKPDKEITIDTSEIRFVHPDKEKNVNFKYDVSDKTGREDQLKKLSDYVISLNKWILDNKDDPYTAFWEEMRDYAQATMLSPTMRGGQTAKPIINIGVLKPVQNLLASVGTYTSKLAQTHLDNLVAMTERSEFVKALHEQKVVVALQKAAKSHGFSTGPTGIEDWFTAVGHRLFSNANQVGRKPSVGDKITMSRLTDVKTVTNEDEAALEAQVKFATALFELDVKAGRGDLILKRRTEEELRRRGGKRGRVIGRKPLKVTDWTLPKTFSSQAIRTAQSIAAQLSDHSNEISDIDADESIEESVKRGLMLQIFMSENRRGDSIYSLIAEDFEQIVLPFLDNREGRITVGTHPFFTEGVYDEARDAMINGDISNLDDLAVFFADRSVDVTKLGDEEVQMQLSKKEALYEILREISTQANRFHDFIYGKIDEDSETSLSYKFAKLKKDSPFTVSRQEPIANYFYYNYGVQETVGVHNLTLDSSSQYIDAFRSSLDSVVGELEAAVRDKQTAASRGNLDEFMSGKKQSAANKESFLDYERAEANLANIKALSNDIDKVRDRDLRYELQVNRTFRRVFGDIISVAIQAPTTALVNLIGTPVRTTMRMQAIFGLAPLLNVKFAAGLIGEFARGAATFGKGLAYGTIGGMWYLGSLRPKKALIKFASEFAEKPFTKDFAIGQHKINSTLRRIHDAGYAMSIDITGKIDAYWDSVETRGRVERATEIRGRGETRSFFSKFYNSAALFLSEIPGTALPRVFDAVGNNISFRFANIAVSNLELRLKDLHRKYGETLWDRYNDPDAMSRDPSKMDALTPVDALGEQFVFDPNESKLGQLENMFMHAGLDFHSEALRFYKSLSADKSATFLSPEQRAQVGIGLVTSENLATIANRPLKLRNDPNVGFLFALSGWSLSAAHNSIEFLSKAQGGKQGWSLNSLNMQLGLVLLGMMTVAGVSYAVQEELMRKIYLHMFGEVRVGRHPWEADSKGEAARRILLYALSGFPIVNAPFNQMLNDQKNMASMGMDLFIQNKVRDSINLVGQLWSTGNVEGMERALLTYAKQTYPNSRSLVNRFPTIAGTVNLINNKRLIQRHAPRDMVKVSSYSGGAATATPLTGIVSKMSSMAALGEFEEFTELFQKAVKVAASMGRPDPVRYVRTLYFGKDPYRAGLKGRVTSGVRNRILGELDEEERLTFLTTEKNFYDGLRMMGGSPRGFEKPTYIASIDMSPNDMPVYTGVGKKKKKSGLYTGMEYHSPFRRVY